MVYYFTSTTGNDVFLNLSREDRTDDDGSEMTQESLAALDVIRSVSALKRIDDEHLVAADVIYDQSVCLSPWTIFGLPLHRDICGHLNRISEFGWSLRESLEEAGAFVFLANLKHRSTYETIIERILNVFTISGNGLSTTSDAPLEFIHAVVDFFRTPDGRDWNQEILGVSDITVQCVSNVVKGLAKVYGDDSLLAKARKHRRGADGTNASWLAFRSSKDRLDQELLEFFNEFVEGAGSRLRPASAQTATLSISSWLKDSGRWESVRDAVADKMRPETFTDFLKRRSGDKITRATLTNAESARRLSVAISEQLAESFEGQALFDLVTIKELNKLKKLVKKLPKPDSTRSRALPEKMIPVMREILEEGADGWPGNSGLFNVTIPVDGNSVTIYCPVIPSLFLAMLDIPLRMGQIRRLDSGEGDAFHFNADQMAWEQNTGSLAGYWMEAAGESKATYDTRGYAREIQDGIKPVTGVNVNTNKTGSPYVVPWFIPSLLTNFWTLRKWQEKYNPINKPIGPDIYLDQSHRYPAETKAEMPFIFPLSRLFKNKFWTDAGRTVTTSEMNHAWCWLLYEIECRWNERHPGNQATLVEIHPRNGQPYRPKYNIHGLRVRGLTNLQRGGMRLELLSKFVAGHATLRMTLYYTMPHATEIADAIEMAVKNSEAQRLFIDDVKKMDVDQAKQSTVSLSPTAVSEAIGSGSQLQFCNVSIGICPFDATRCDDGGALQRKEEKDGTSKNVYAKVERRNCVMCRHFISGPPWLSELLAYGTKLCESRQFLAREQARIDELVAAYEREFKLGKVTKAFFENKYDALQAEIIQVKDQQEITENSIYNVELLCNASKKLLDVMQDKESKVLLVAHPYASTVEYEQISEFSQSVWITALGRVHQILGDDRVEAKRDKYLDIMLWNSGITPPGLMTEISADHRKKAMDQYALFISQRASSMEINGLVDGSIRLKDLELYDEVSHLLNAVLSEPILLPGVQARLPMPALGRVG